jgi:serine/threonine protein kinase
MNIKNITNPREIIYINNEIKGYTMDYINYEMTLKHCMQSKRTLEEKINYLKQMEKIIKELHKNNVVLVDLMYHNFVISDKVIKAIDIDNYHLDNYNTDFIPSTIFDSYLENINCKIDSDMDKYNNSFFMLYYLCNQSFKPSQAHGDIEFFQSFISKLNISNNLKNLFIEIKVKYDFDLRKFVYYLPSWLVDKDNLNQMHFNLYELKIADESNVSVIQEKPNR